VKDLCKLCGKIAELRKSHIFPDFVIRWMKETGPGYLRFSENPNVRQQDGQIIPLLCDSCEQHFSKREEYFASTFFRPTLNGFFSRINYDERLAYFLVSICWRVLHVHLPKAKADTCGYLNLVEEAEFEWRKFLINFETPKISHLHLFILDTMNQNPPGTTYANFFATRGIAASLFKRGTRVYVVAKFARFLCAAILNPYDENTWKGTRINFGSGFLEPPQIIEDVAVGGWLVDRTREVDKMIESGFSQKQTKSIAKNIESKWEELEGSDFMKSIVADLSDHERVKENAKRVGRNDKCPCGSGLKFKKCHGR
jgi:hypothetical protein